MKKFQFKFEALLKFRQLKVKPLERQLGQMLTKARWYADRLLSIKEEFSRAQTDLVQSRLAGDLKKNREVTEYLTTLQETASALEVAHADLCIKVKKMKKEVEKAMTERKIIENLRKTHYTAYLKQKERKEESDLDELRSSHHPR